MDDPLDLSNFSGKSWNMKKIFVDIPKILYNKCQTN